ncbi:prephenate dehydrogenase/arogenate dehydrogenase family protein [bacterium]|nr:prephenate dehydrogenase/arogenate dehydrogenase family protein [bacterium]MBU4561466.1 prephenate dehydrogenase/arogenate dehydrogenase family protein [bacterium]MCG2676921.1 prephenate dehydrogenase/arogenate dehydrogenase family protein [bacterium]MCG2677303.1 prephenate dehydrogenase/arogenate dehydrogenase family protein [bacterium]
MPQQINQVAIIGVGLIGGSLGLALKEKKIAKRIIGVGRREESLKVARERREVDEITTDLTSGVKDADLVVIATPLELTIETFRKILPHLKKGCVVTDVGSVKGPILKRIDHPFFIGGHPLAGSEKRGPQAARADLFKEATVVLTPVKKTDKKALALVKSMWQDLGAKVLFLDCAIHDRLVAFTSHLPHILAASLTNLIGELAQEEERVLSLMGEGFRDTTRIAASPPSMWKEISFANREEISKAIKRFKEILSEMEEALSKEEGDNLLHKFEKAKETRDKL